MCLWHIFFIHSPVGRCLNCFHNLAFVNMLNIVHIWISAFNSFEDKTRSGIGGLYGNSMFNFLRNCLTVFHNGCAVLHPHQQCGESYFPTSLLIFVTFLVDVKWFLIVILFPWWLTMLSTFSCAFWHMVYLLWRNCSYLFFASERSPDCQIVLFLSSW